MSGLLEGLAGAIGGDAIGQLAGALGTDNDMASKAVAVALPALLGGLARNAQTRQGADSLFGALGNDHDGSVLGSLGSLFGGSAPQQQQTDGEKILGHVLGNKRPRVERQVAQSSGLDMGVVSKLLPILAPVVLGYLGKKMRSDNMSRNDLTAELLYERAEVKQNDSMLGGVLDLLNGDDDASNGGLMDIAGDLITGPAGKAILGSLLGGR